MKQNISFKSNPQGFIKWTFLLAGMLVTTILYLFYDNSVDFRKKVDISGLANPAALNETVKPSDSDDSLGWGMTLGPLTQEIRRMYNIPEDIQGVVVLSVVSGSKSDSVGIKSGDVIQGLDKNKIIDMESFFAAVYSDTDKTSLLDIYSEGHFRYVPIDSLGLGAINLKEYSSLKDLDKYIGVLQAVPIVGIIGIVLALLIYASLFKYSPGDKKMRSIALKIKSGTEIFLQQEYKVTFVFLSIFFIFLSYVLTMWTALAFLVGSFCSMLPGWMGMKASTTANVRTTQAAKEEGLFQALNIAFWGGSVMGIFVASIGIIGLGFFSLIALSGNNPYVLMDIVKGFTLGASFFALFGRVGGGIFTKSADIGADMAGKIELGLPEDDPRNPAVIADNVGDNVGDIAGMGSDFFESYVSSVVAAIAMALTMPEPVKYIALPLILITVGLVSCILSIFLSKFFRKFTEPQTLLRNITYVASGIFLIGACVVTTAMTGAFYFFWIVLAGILCGILVALETEYFTSGQPIRYIVNMSKTGAATNIIAGLAVGFQGAFLPIVTISLTILIALKLAGAYGIGLSAVAMLSTIAMHMAIDAYGPIVDNAGGIAEMSGADKEVRKITDELDVVGNITAAIGKGFTLGTGIISTVALFAAFMVGTGLQHIELFTPKALVGLFIGVTLPFLFAALTMGAVSRIANKLVVEIRRQFRKTKNLLSGKTEPDTDKCIEIITRNSLKATAMVGTISVTSPFIVAFTLGKEALGGYLVGAMVTGSILGMSMTIGGAAWDNAKKLIKKEHDIKGEMETAYKAAIVGDMVGDPFKDVSGPSMNILIKLMTTIALVFCSVFCKL